MYLNFLYTQGIFLICNQVVVEQMRLDVKLLAFSFSRKDQEEQGQCQIQGALQQVPVHPGHHRQGEG